MAHSWGLWGEGNELGTINNLTAEHVLFAAGSIKTGTVHCLSLPLDVPGGSPGPRKPYRHTIYRPDRNTQDDYLEDFYLQFSSQWDGLRHVQAREFGFYGGVSEFDAGPDGARLGIEQWARRGIVGRGVLVDVCAYLDRQSLQVDPFSSFQITTSMIEGTLEQQQVTLREGDILLIRTGYVSALLSLAPAERLAKVTEGHSLGLSAGEDMAEYLWDHHLAAVVADNLAVEAMPVDPTAGFLHRRLIPMLGFALGELFALDGLAECCRDTGYYTCFFVAAPLYLPGGVGSPANAVAIT